MTATLTPLSDLDDATLIRHCLEQTPGAYDALIKRYLRTVYHFVLQYVQDISLAEDLTQETFLRVYRSLGKFDRSRAFQPWLLTIAANLCKSHLEKSSHNRRYIPAEEFEHLADSYTADMSIGDSQLQTVLESALKTLPTGMRQALLLRYVHDLPYETIARILDTKLNTVRTWLKRGRENLKTLLEDQGVW